MAESDKLGGLEDALRNLNAFELDDVMKKRSVVLEELENELYEWLKDYMMTHDTSLNKEQFDAVECSSVVRLVTYGGHSLGVATRGSDVDAVCIVPKFVERSDFFSGFASRLRLHPHVTSLRVIEGAHVPLLKFIFHQTQVDLCLAVIGVDRLSAELDAFNELLLQTMDLQSIRSLDGVKKTLALKNSVPNVQIFIGVLKIIKVWAKKSGVHSSQFGFPGGISWSILVAYVCLLYPTANVCELVRYFFQLYTVWDWSNPVLLKPLSSADLLGLQPWNPKRDVKDSYHVMAVVTPAYPECNSTYCVNNSALAVVNLCLQEGLQVIDKITAGSASCDKLFQPVDFFSRYKHFLKVCVQARSDDDLADWSGLVSSRLRVLITGLEKQSSIKFIHLLADSFNNGLSICWFIGLNFEDGQKIHFSLEKDVTDFEHHVTEIGRKRNIHKPGMSVDISHVTRKQLSKHLPVRELRRLNEQTSTVSTDFDQLKLV